jgi:hypothetical protein
MLLSFGGAKMRPFEDPELRAKHGNLKGRPIGMGALVRQAKKLAEDELPAIVAKMVEMAKQGDMVAASFLVSRFIPLPKPLDAKVEFPLPADIAPGDLDRITHAIVAAVAEGRLDPTSGAKLVSSLVAHTSLVSTKDVQHLSEELAALKLMFEGKPNTINASAVGGRRMEPDDPSTTPNGAE